MRKIIWVLALVYGLQISMSPAFAKAENDKKKGFSELFSKGVVKGERKQFEGAFADDVLIFPEYQKALIGHKKARRYYDALFARFDFKDYQRTVIEVIELGSKRVEIGTFTMAFSPKGENQFVSLPGTYFDVWDIATDNHYKLVTQAWNYDKYIEGIENMFRFDDLNGVHYAFEPVALIKDPTSYEVAAIHALGIKQMLQKQPEVMALKYAEDAWYAPHSAPLAIGQPAIKTFLLDYAKNWPAFDFIDVHAHQIHHHGKYVMEYTSYNLRWHTDSHSGISIGKGIRISRRNKDGTLQVFRAIAMHD